jgi:hypothetical protein
MTGTVPENLRLPKLCHLDLGRNQFRGPLLADFADKAGALRLFHIDHNEFTGAIPALYSQTGRGRVVWYAINNNQFTGVPPVEDLQFGNVLGTNERTSEQYVVLKETKKYMESFTHAAHFSFGVFLFAVSYTMHNNMFTTDLDKDFCKQSVFLGGEMVEMKADCGICSCKDNYCDNCVP